MTLAVSEHSWIGTPAGASNRAASAVCDVSIVIVNWNTCDLLRGCLRSIYRETHNITFEVFVVDNASGDGSAEMVSREFPDVRLIRNQFNNGFAAANNQGIRIARGRFVLLLNPDTVIVDAVVERTLRFAESHPDVAVVGCQVMLSPQEIQQTCFSFPTPWHLFLVNSKLSALVPRNRWFARPTLSDWDRKSERDVDVVSGMYMLVRRDAIEQVGRMDESYFVYAEEADWCYQFRQHGWRCVFAPVGQIIHLDGGGKSTRQVNAKMYVQMQKSLLHFQRKNFGCAAYLAVKTMFILSNVVRAATWSLARLFLRSGTANSRAGRAIAALKFHLAGIEPQ
jgi:GT2 family glycosyltransferase